MTRDCDFSGLYNTLGLEPGCNWDEIRQAYRREAQLWHPDRFPEASPERAVAEKRIVLVNQAYQILAKHRKKFGELPGRDRKRRTDKKTHRARNRHTTHAHPPGASPLPQTADTHPGWQAAQHRVPQSGYRVISLVTLVVLSIAVYGFLSWSPERPLTGDSAASLPQIEPSAHVEPMSPEIVRLPRGDISQNYFTVGSTMSKVNDIQGIPTRIEGETWFYGASKVHFIDGLVAYWKIHPSDPLYAIQTYNASRDRANPRLQRGRFMKGSSKSDVRTIQGKPLFESENLWQYRVSRVYFKNGKVVEWHNSPLDPLKVKNSRKP